MIIQHKALARVGEDPLSTWSINISVTFEQDRASARCACFAVYIHERTSCRFTAAHHDLVFCSGGWFGAIVSISQANLQRLHGCVRIVATADTSGPSQVVVTTIIEHVRSLAWRTSRGVVFDCVGTWSQYGYFWMERGVPSDRGIVSRVGTGHSTPKTT